MQHMRQQRPRIKAAAPNGQHDLGTPGKDSERQGFTDGVEIQPGNGAKALARGVVLWTVRSFAMGQA
ncbi:MAG: hypothetical protein H6650_00555 [Ardenticatenales bacterium]|nr:hypothetical protein [Ardenticatenales bacterium]